MNKNLKIYFTSDTHGYLFPVDYATGNHKNTGVLSCINDFKKDGNTLVIDGGDTAQGSPFTLFSHRLETEVHPVAAVFNKGGYDFVTLGNHEFNYGQKHLRHYLNSLDAEVLCANVAGDMPMAPSAIKVLENGLKIGLVGIVTDWVNVWERPEHIENLTISDPFEAAAQAVENLKGQVDITVCIYHGGFECDLETGASLTESTENIGYRICRELDFDILLTGHQHMPVAGKYIHGTFAVQTGHNATHYLEINGEVTAKGIHFKGEIKEPTGGYDGTGLEKVEAIEADVQKWLDAPVGFLDQALEPKDKVTMALEGASLVNFFHQVQFAASGAQISVTSLANQVKGFSSTVTVRDVVSTYVYPNTMVVLEVTGVVLKSVLERTVSYFELDTEGKPQVSNRFLQPKVEHYNYDFFAGITYTADLRKPVGERLVEIRYQDKAIQPTDTFTICMNNYRATGAGGYEAYHDCPVVKEIQTEISELIINFLEANKIVEVASYPAPTFIY